MVVNRITTMGGRAGGGARSGGGGGGAAATPKYTIQDARAALKKVSSAKAAFTRAEKELMAAEGSYRWTAQSEKAKAEAKIRYEKAQKAYGKAMAKVWAAKDAANRILKVYNGSQI